MSDANYKPYRSRVFIVDDHPIVREGLALKICAEPDMIVCGEAEDVTEALTRLPAAVPDVILIDISLKAGNGIELVKRIRARDGTARMLVWSMHAESLYAERALRAGAMGYVNKRHATSHLIAALRTVLSGQVYVSADLTSQFLTRLVGENAKATGGGAVVSLTDRELEAFTLLGRGLSTQQIAEQMHISGKTVETHRLRIKEKLGVTTLAELIQRATHWAMETN